MNIFHTSSKMKLLPALLLCFAASAAAQKLRIPAQYTPTPIELKGKALTSEEHNEKRARIALPYSLRFTEGSGELLFAGTTHFTNPDNEQVAKLQQLWNEFKPTVALVEGRPDLIFPTLDESVKKFGEGGAVLWLAERDKVPVFTMEPDRNTEAAYLLERARKEEVALFLALRTYLSDKRTRVVDDAEFAKILGKRQRQYGLTGALPDVLAVDKLWGELFPGHAGWREMNEREMWPNAKGSILSRIAVWANEVRDAHFLATMIDLTRKGERVFAVSGCSHTINLEPVLKATLSGRT